MTTFNFARAVQAALIAAAIGSTSTAALADIKDYKFELIDQTVQEGADRVITVRLLNTSTGKPVPDAVIIATRLDMAPFRIACSWTVRAAICVHTIRENSSCASRSETSAMVSEAD